MSSACRCPSRRDDAGSSAATHALRPEGEVDFAHAIRTTDALDKHACIDVALDAGTVRLTAQAKGAGMISPNFATLLCFVQTDAAMSAETCDLLLGVTVRRSFERISVDGQLSTSDTVILQASGESGVAIEPETEDEVRFGEAMDAVLRQLALNIVRDGEGARRVGRVIVRGGGDEVVHRVARAVADSPLVKTALYGGDPELGADRPGRRDGDARDRAARGRGDDRGDRRYVPGADSSRTTRTPSSAQFRATRSSTRSTSPERAQRPSCTSPT